MYARTPDDARPRVDLAKPVGYRGQQGRLMLDRARPASRTRFPSLQRRHEGSIRRAPGGYGRIGGTDEGHDRRLAI